jgi:hypothetical protein
LVFSGTVAAIKGDPDGIFATFDVHLVWKGSVARRLILPLYMDLDAFRLVERTNYLIFADGLSLGDPRASRGPTETAPVFYISSCGPSRQLTNLNDRVQDLGKPRRPPK